MGACVQAAISHSLPLAFPGASLWRWEFLRASGCCFYPRYPLASRCFEAPDSAGAGNKWRAAWAGKGSPAPSPALVVGDPLLLTTELPGEPVGRKSYTVCARSDTVACRRSLAGTPGCMGQAGPGRGEGAGTPESVRVHSRTSPHPSSALLGEPPVAPRPSGSDTSPLLVTPGCGKACFLL